LLGFVKVEDYLNQDASVWLHDDELSKNTVISVIVAPISIKAHIR